VSEKTPYLTSKKLRDKSNNQHQLLTNSRKELSSFYMQEKVTEIDDYLGGKTNGLVTLSELHLGAEKGKVLL
jgi:hypothetical protein